MQLLENKLALSFSLNDISRKSRCEQAVAVCHSALLPWAVIYDLCTHTKKDLG